MPIYEYECRSCGHRFEAVVTASQKATGCEKCGSANTLKLPSVFHQKSHGPSSHPSGLKPFRAGSAAGAFGPEVLSPGEFTSRVTGKGT